jgi:hypothetical protein
LHGALNVGYFYGKKTYKANKKLIDVFYKKMDNKKGWW